ncbi:MAG: SDR family NAD(P)-dependent oxidoreductase, partial [Pseudomonadota bacterium]|nr:SDR family NAD(P)-dependent oxidoreductase [Pseudomonadota bacterium]
MNKRTIFITGGASGIGLGMAETLVKQGHHVIVADINESAAQEAAAVLASKFGSINDGSASAVAVDVCDAAQ